MNENQLGVLLENILDKVNAIAEGQRVLEEKMEKGFHEVKTDIKKLKSDSQIIKSFVMAIEDGMNDYEKRIRKLERNAT